MAVHPVQMEAALTVDTMEAGVPDEPVATLPKAMHASMSDADMQQLCKKLEAQLKPAAQVCLGLRSPHALPGKPPVYQVAHSIPACCCTIHCPLDHQVYKCLLHFAAASLQQSLLYITFLSMCPCTSAAPN